MLDLMQLHVGFLCRSTRSNAKGESPIVLRIIYRGERRDLFTGLYCTRRSWNADLGRVGKANKQGSTLNKNLDLIQYKVLQIFDELKFSGTPFTMDELVNRVKGKEEKPDLLIDYLRERNLELKKRVAVDIVPATYEKYERSLRFVINFLEKEYKRSNYPLFQIDAAFLDNYFQYLRTVRKIGHNTSVKYLTFLRTILMPAIRSGALRENPFLQMKYRIKTVYKGFLTDEELEQLRETRIASGDLDRIRDQYLFCCYTGLAYSDLKQLALPHFIRQHDGEYYILKPRQKTGQQSIIPLMPVARRILEKYSPTDDFREFSWHVSANQKMNQRLKKIGDLCRIKKDLHMHLARHTFATTATLSKGVPIESVSSMLGHATLRQTQHYAKVVAMKVVNDMARVKELYK